MPAHKAEPAVDHREQNGDRHHDDSDDDLMQRLDRLWARARKETDQQSKPFSSRMVGVKVGSYTISRLIGTGSFGVIFKAEAEALSRSVALKIPRHEVLADRDKLRRFQVEAISSASLDHPGIVPVYDADLDSDPPYIVSAYCPGPNLQQWLEEYGPPKNTDDSVKLLLQIATAVEHAHSQGVIHRDLKPSNVMLVEPGDDETVLSNYSARITDFGLARLAQTDMLQSNSSLVLGTPLYMAPEQAECRFDEVGPVTDVFALGAILFELLSGRTPFAAENYSSLLIQLREDAPESVLKHRPNISRDLDVICKTCLQRNTADRYPSADALAKDLSRYLACEPD